MLLSLLRLQAAVLCLALSALTSSTVLGAAHHMGGYDTAAGEHQELASAAHALRLTHKSLLSLPLLARVLALVGVGAVVKRKLLGAYGDDAAEKLLDTPPLLSSLDPLGDAKTLEQHVLMHTLLKKQGPENERDLLVTMREERESALLDFQRVKLDLAFDEHLAQNPEVIRYKAEVQLALDYTELLIGEMEYRQQIYRNTGSRELWENLIDESIYNAENRYLRHRLSAAQEDEL